MSQSKFTAYTLGLDIGIASVGAALLGEEEKRILGLHVRTFVKGEVAKTGDSLNLIRRTARLARRRLRRRAQRLLRLRRAFKKEGLIQNTEPSSFYEEGFNPWEGRFRGLDHKLSPKTWASVLYHIIKHRGFQSTRKSEAKNADEETGKMLKGVGENSSILRSGKYRTVGEMAWKDPKFEDHKRNKGGQYLNTFDRKDLVDEIKVLFKKQRELGNTFTSKEFEDKITSLILARKPALSGNDLLNKVGYCTFEKKERRAPKKSYSSERFVWLTKLNNLRIQGPKGARPLSPEEREVVLDKPYEMSKFTYKQLRKTIDLDEEESFAGLRYSYKSKTGEAKDPEDATLFEAKFFHAVKKTYIQADLGGFWMRDSKNPARLDEIGFALTCYKTDEDIRKYLLDKQIEPPIVEALLELSFDEFINLSTKALIKILPFMEAGSRYDQAVEQAGYQSHSDLRIDLPKGLLPKPDKEMICNPVVYRALNQARKLVNAIVQQYGPPSRIHIELARDLNKPFDERKKIEKEQTKFRENKENAIKEFSDHFGQNPGGLDLQKYLLYKEQDAKCAYSGKGLDLSRLLETGYTEVDHILPYSRSFDDSQNNKALVLTDQNRNKKNQTPYEFLGGAQNTREWIEFEAKVNSNKKISVNKKIKLLRIHFGQDEAEEFKERNLNDTRYICREFKKMVENHLRLSGDVFNDNRCVVVSGRFTSLLRTRWGLLKKREEGDLHHALDAAVIAASSPSMIRRIANYSRWGELGQLDSENQEIEDRRFPKPWGHFREELLAWLSPNPREALSQVIDYDQERLSKIYPIRVSRAPTRRGLGAAHQETIRSMKQDGTSITKTSLQSLKLSDLEKIAGYHDPRNQPMIQALKERLQAYNNDGKKAFTEPFYKPDKEGNPSNTLVRSVKLIDTQKSGIPVRQGIANNGDMLRIDLFKKANKHYVVPIYVADAVKSVLPDIPVPEDKKSPKIDHTFQFMFSLYPNDWVRVTKSDGNIAEGYFVCFDRAGGKIDIRWHDSSAPDKRGIGLKTVASIQKFHVDLLGRLYLAKQETRQPIVIKKTNRVL